MGLARKLRRVKKKQLGKDIKKTLGLFDKIPDHCLTCFAPYDKMDKEQVKTWNVVVREKEDKVNLYCPDCWNSAANLLEEIRKDIEGANEESNE